MNFARSSNVTVAIKSKLAHTCDFYTLGIKAV